MSETPDEKGTEVMRILVVDDEPLARQRLRRYLNQYNSSFAIAEAGTGLQAVELIKGFAPDIILLDIEMPGLSGFEVLQQFEERPFSIIFQTAYDEFAIRAFEEHACDYLLKPFTPERFAQALDHAITRRSDEERLKSLESKISEKEGCLRRLTVKQGGRLTVVEDRDITCFVSRDHYTCVYFDGQREGISDLSLNRLAERLDPAIFKQLHRNNIVKISAITSAYTTRDGQMWVETNTGMRLPVSRKHRRFVRGLMRDA